jgi:ATP-binding cassette subfamily C (CFTR/MRP) protein 4
LSLICASLLIAVTFTVGKWTGEDKEDQKDSVWFHYFYGAVILYVFAGFSRCLIVALSCLTSSQRIHTHMVWKMLRAPVVFFDSNPIGTVLTRFSKDIGVTDFILPQMINFLLITLFKVTVIAIFIIAIIPWNIIIILIIIVPMYMIRRYSMTAQNDAQRLESMSKGPINTKYSSALDGITTIRAYQKQNYFIDSFMIDSDLNSAAKFTLNGLQRWSAQRLDLCGIVFSFGNMLLITILVNYFSLLDKNLSSITVQFTLEFVLSSSVMVRFFGEVENMLTSAQRTMEYAKLEMEDDLVKENDPKNWPETSDIYFNDVHMKYRPHLPPVLKGLTYHVKTGQKVGIIGRTGAGKSSIMQVIFRLVEAEPDSKIIIGGENIRDIGLHCLRNNISFIPQTPFLISSSIRENLDPFETYTEENVWEVLEEVQLKNYVKNLKDGLDTELSDQNIFSVGQKQLICLARAILRKNKILVLDEATANVDIETDNLIQRTIREKFKDCTVLTIAHRIATISDSDVILVLEDGRLKKHGSPEKILAKLFRRESQV